MPIHHEPPVPAPVLSVADQDLLHRTIGHLKIDRAEIVARRWTSDPRDPLGAAMMTQAMDDGPHDMLPWLLEAGVSPNVIKRKVYAKQTTLTEPNGKITGLDRTLIWDEVLEPPTSVLRHALQSVSPQALDILLSAGARWDHWEHPQVNPIHGLATMSRVDGMQVATFRSRQEACLEVLVQHGGTLDAKAAARVVPEAMAVALVSPRLIARLVELGADPFAVSGHYRFGTFHDVGQTALHHAMAFSHDIERSAHVHALLDLGLDLQALDKNGATPLDLLRDRHWRVVDVSPFWEADQALLVLLEQRVIRSVLDHDAPKPSLKAPRARL